MSFSKFKLGCEESSCKFHEKTHLHCARIRCHFAANDPLVISNHITVFHLNDFDIPEDREFYHIDVACSSASCQFNRISSHWHCLKCQTGFEIVALHCCPVPKTPPKIDSCSRPFCKLRKKAHYHCKTCDQGFSNSAKLFNHNHRSQKFMKVIDPKLSMVRNPQKTEDPKDFFEIREPIRFTMEEHFGGKANEA